MLKSLQFWMYFVSSLDRLRNINRFVVGYFYANTPMKQTKK